MCWFDALIKPNKIYNLTNLNIVSNQYKLFDSASNKTKKEKEKEKQQSNIEMKWENRLDFYFFYTRRGSKEQLTKSYNIY